MRCSKNNEGPRRLPAMLMMEPCRRHGPRAHRGHRLRSRKSRDTACGPTQRVPPPSVQQLAAETPLAALPCRSSRRRRQLPSSSSARRLPCDQQRPTSRLYPRSRRDACDQEFAPLARRWDWGFRLRVIFPIFFFSPCGFYSKLAPRLDLCQRVSFP
jgi:hypothetical protein